MLIAIAVDTVLMAGALWAALALGLEKLWVLDKATQVFVALTLIALTLVFFWIAGLYRNITRYVDNGALKLIAAMATLSAAFLIIAAQATPLPLTASVPID